ncbi:AraC-like DNA-binding protein [Bradyrhizobium sp. CIR48]|uniref:helix-turn-helix domain-containing protein n=1 Tax=Bradyrhizobium sp. CIR48 TaxID=2663840 RepID=UPI0017E25E96|nr:AraC family transcriptional regulator [Bradyrhizobium sp. CIR48]MBB4424415.1 AraC-like DNA-binding protein [Bradyrhizobium sp. CIR48]
MNNSKNMIESPVVGKRDRLSAFFDAFELSVTVAAKDERDAVANLVILGEGGSATRVTFCPHRDAMLDHGGGILAAAAIRFGGVTNPLMNAIPERIVIPLSEAPTLQALTAAFVTEASDMRCGRQVALNRLCEVIILLVLRRAIDIGSTQPGLLAGLSHPAIHKALVAMHDQPSRPWHTEELASISGLSRSRFMTLFPKVTGTTPAAYLKAWRLTLGQRELQRGERIKSVARRVGFGSAAAFSRAYALAFGHSPVSLRKPGSLSQDVAAAT